MFLTYIHQTSSLQASFSNIAHAMIGHDYIFIHLIKTKNMYYDCSTIHSI